MIHTIRWSLGLGLAAMLLSPVFASAQTLQELQAQAQALLAKVQQLQAELATQNATTVTNTSTGGGTTYAGACPQIGRSLSQGDSGDDVTRLQQFLASDPSVYPEALVTGYYGALTEAAVQRWQVKYNIVSSGTPATTGYGVVGPRTAAAISILCSTGSYNGVSGPSGTSGPVGGFVQITPVSGNAPLAVTVQATVNTVNSCAGAVYTLDYGDGTQPAQIAVPAGHCAQMTQALGHTYSYGGVYQITLSAGGHRTSAAVQVFGSGAPSGGGTGTSGSVPNRWGIISLTPAVNNNPLTVAVEIEYPRCKGYRIDWGDSSADSIKNPPKTCTKANVKVTVNHTYSDSGTYTISLRDDDNDERVSSAVSISD